MSESEPIVKTQKSVSFSEDTKKHDGLTPSTQLFDLLVVHYMSIGGMRHIGEMTTFLESKDYSLNISRREELLSMGECLLTRIIESKKATPILPTGGGSNCKVPKEGLPNIQHMLIVLKTELMSQKN
jgi:hypothetical protein